MITLWYVCVYKLITPKGLFFQYVKTPVLWYVKYVKTPVCMFTTPYLDKLLLHLRV